jgi:hypothetical protein
MYQQGNFPLTEGQTTYNVSFSLEFPNTEPSLILTNVFNANSEDPQLTLVGNITDRDQEGFTFELSTPPDSDSYVLSWMASDGLGTTVIQTNGIPVAEFTSFNNLQLPDNTLFPAILTNGPKKSITVSWGRLKNFLVKSHTHLVEEISNISATAKAFLTALSPSAARQVIEAASAIHTHTSEQISDSTTIGRGLIQAVDAAGARELIDAAAAEHTQPAASIDAAAHIESFLQSANTAGALTAIGAANAVHTHIINDISNAGNIGKAVLAAGDTETALSSLKAMPENGWRDGGSISTTRNLNTSDYGKKFTCSNICTISIPINLTGKFKVAFTVLVDDVFSIATESTVVIYNNRYESVAAPILLKTGFYILENVDINSFVLVGYENEFQRILSSADNSEELKSIFSLPSDEELGVSAIWQTVTDTIVATGITDLSNYTLDVVTINSAIELSTALPIGKHYYLRNGKTNGNLTVIPGSGRYINFSGSPSLELAPGEIIKVTYRSTNRFEVDYKYTNLANPKTIYVSANGSDDSGQIGNPDKPFQTITVALAKATASCNTIHVKPGSYNIFSTASNAALTEINYYFEPGANVFVNGPYVAFYLNKSGCKLNVYGFGNFSVSNEAVLIGLALSADIYFEANRINIYNTNTQLFFDDFGGSTARINVNSIQAPATTTVVTTQSGTTLYIGAKDVVLGGEAFSVFGTSLASLSVSNGTLTLNNRLVKSNSSANGLFKLNLINSDVIQSEAPSDYLFKFNSCKIRISGFNSTIFGDYGNRSIWHESGTALISGVKIINPIYVNGPGLTLDGVSIEVGDAETYCLDTPTGSNFPVSILKTCASNKDFNPDLTFRGGDLVIESEFNL